MELFHKMISGLSGISEKQISSTLHLLGEGATIPFISRYRKEATCLLYTSDAADE